MELLKKIQLFNGNTLKLLAAVFMLIDHFGVIFFPTTVWIRCIGRLAMPIFAFALSEGCRYTRNKVKHFFLLFALGVVCQLVYCIVAPTNLYFNILITFSFSVLMIYLLQYAKKQSFGGRSVHGLRFLRLFQQYTSFANFSRSIMDSSVV